MPTGEEYLASLGIDTKDADKAVAQLIEGISALGSTFSGLEGRTEKIERSLAALTRTQGDVNKAVRSGSDEVRSGSSRWQQYAKALSDAQSAYRAFRQDQVTGDTTAGAADLPQSRAALQQLLATYEATNASIISAARQRVTALEAIDAGYARVSAARSNSEYQRELAQLNSLERAQRQYADARRELKNANSQVGRAQGAAQDDPDRLVAALRRQESAVNGVQSAYMQLQKEKARDAATTQAAINQAIAGYERQTNAMVAGYSRAYASARQLEAANISAAKASIAQSDQRIGAAWSANDRDAQIAKEGRLAVAKRELEAATKSLTAAERAQRAAAATGDIYAQDRAMRQLADATDEARRAQLEYNSAQNAQAQSIRAAEGAALSYASQLPRLRYALFDVSNALGLGSAAALAGVVASGSVAVAWQRDFAQVIRTSQATGDQVGSLRDDFTELAQTIPEAHSDLTRIGTLGGQIGVGSNNLASFTKTVAEFSATTNVTAEESAQAFGRLDSLLPGVAGNYNALGSSILQVGVNSAATESQIISTAQQIAAAGTQAGLTYEQVIGLAGAFSSLGVAPESARGTVLRFFTQINGAIDGSNGLLGDFAAVSGKTAAQFQQDWASDKQKAILDLLNGLQARGVGAQSTLEGLGVTASRDITNILRLAGSTDVLAQSFDDANAGAENGTVLNDQYGQIASTVAAQLQLLVNNAQAFLATIGQQTGPLSAVISLLNQMLQAATSVAQNPVAQWAFTLTGAIVALLAVMAIGVAGFLRVQGSVLAMRSAFIASAEAGTAENVVITRLGVATGILNKETIAAAAAQRQLASSNLEVAGTGAAADASMDKMGSTGGKLGKVLGAAGLLGTLITLVPMVAQFGNDTAAAAAKASAGVDNLDAAVLRLMKDKGQFDFAIATLSNATDAQKMQNLKNGGSLPLEGQNPGIVDAQEYRDKKSLNDAGWGFIKGASADLDVFNAKLAAVQAAIVQTFQTGNTAQAQQEYQQLVDKLTSMGFTQEEVNNLTSDYQTVLAGAGGEAGVAADQQEILNQQIQDSLSALNDAINAQLGMQDSLYGLGESLFENGDSFDYYSENGRANIKALQDTISSYAAAFSGDAQGLANNLQALYNYILQNTSAPAQALAMLRNAIAATGAKPTSGPTLPITSLMNGYAAASDKAAKSAAKSAAAAREQIRTLEDYAGDLQKVLGRSFEIRFGGQEAYDKIAGSWNSIRDAISKVNLEIQQYQADMATLTADRATREYWLSVAENYGDALRAGELRAEIADIDAQLASKANDLTNAQQENSKSIDGNSDAAIKNRQDLSNLAQQYQAYIVALASSGVGQEELQARSTQLRAEFVAQALQMGYSQQAVDTYAVAFDDLKVSIDRVPRNITVTADTNPAMQSLNEYEARLRQIGGNTYGGGNVAPPNYGNAARIAELEALIAVTANFAKLQSFRQDQGAANDALARIAAYQNELRNLRGYESGGWTGPGARNKPKGIVHAEEFVLNRTGAQVIPRGILEAANQGRSLMPMVVQRSAPVQQGSSQYDRAVVGLLGEIADRVGLTIQGPLLQGAVAGASQNDRNRGSW